MSSTGAGAGPDLEHRALMPMVVAVSRAMGWILLPFCGTLLWSATVALLFASLHRRLLQPLRHRRTLAALLTLFAVWHLYLTTRRAATPPSGLSTDRSQE